MADQKRFHPEGDRHGAWSLRGKAAMVVSSDTSMP